MQVPGRLPRVRSRHDDLGSLAFDALFGEGGASARGTPVAAAAAALRVGTNCVDSLDGELYASGAVLFRLIAKQCGPRDAWEASLLQAVRGAKAAAGDSSEVLCAALRAAGYDATTVSAAGHAGAGLSLKHSFVAVERRSSAGAARRCPRFFCGTGRARRLESCALRRAAAAAVRPPCVGAPARQPHCPGTARVRTLFGACDPR
jgi:hypothetical protein